MRQFATLLLLLSLLLPASAAVTPYATQLNTANSTGTNSISYWVAPINGGASDFMYYWDSATLQPKALTLGAGISISSGVLTASTSTPQPASQTRSFNAAFQASALAGARVHYACKIATTASIGSGQEGEIILEQADDSGFTANVITLDILSNGQTYTLAIAIQGVQSLTGSLGADYVPAGKYLRLRTNNITGSPSYTYRNGREVLE